MSIFTSLILPLAARTTFSSVGPSCLQGPHHSAQKSTSTGWRLDSSITSLTKVCVVVSLTALPAAVASPPCNIVIPVRPSSLPPRRAASIAQWNRSPSAPLSSVLPRASEKGPRPRCKPAYCQLNGVHGGVCNSSRGGASCSATGTIRGGCPVASRNRSKSAPVIEVVIVLTSG